MCIIIFPINPYTRSPIYTQHHFQLGFDADVLEIQLNELDPVVDRVFIMESTRTHNKVSDGFSQVTYCAACMASTDVALHLYAELAKAPSVGQIEKSASISTL